MEPKEDTQHNVNFLDFYLKMINHVYIKYELYILENQSIKEKFFKYFTVDKTLDEFSKIIEIEGENCIKSLIEEEGIDNKKIRNQFYFFRDFFHKIDFIINIKINFNKINKLIKENKEVNIDFNLFNRIKILLELLIEEINIDE